MSGANQKGLTNVWIKRFKIFKLRLMYVNQSKTISFLIYRVGVNGNTHTMTICT
jgi:hypothetical protein